MDVGEVVGIFLCPAVKMAAVEWLSNHALTKRQYTHVVMDNIEANQPLDDVRGANFTANGRTPDHVVNVHA